MPRAWDAQKDMPDLTGKVAIVTGGNTVLGKEVVRHLALHNAKVYMATRTESRALSSIEELEKDHPEFKERAAIVFLQIDLTSLVSCQTAARAFLEKEERLDMLVNNAGIMGWPYELTSDGIEAQFQTNHLGHFAFTIPLLPLLIKTSKDPKSSVRVVNVTSAGHAYAGGIGKSKVTFDSVEDVNRDVGTWKLYGRSKLANVLFTKELARKLADERIFVVAAHPGSVDTEISRGLLTSYRFLSFIKPFSPWILTTPYKGALTPLYCASAPEIEQNNWRGDYFVPTGKRAEPSPLSKDPQLARDLWELSEKIVKEKTEK